MTPFFTRPFPKSGYFRLLEYQKKMKLPSYRPDYPLIFFILFSRVAAGLALVSVFFPPSALWTGFALFFMGLATLASIAHLSVPLRFLTMVRNNKSFLVWEVRLAGALTAFLGLQFFSFFGYLERLNGLFPWINFVLSIFFLISTGWAYRFETHPAWKTSILPVYYIASASMIGLALRAMYYPLAPLPFLYAFLLITEAFLLLLYRNHLRKTSPAALGGMIRGDEKRLLLAFLWAVLLLPALLTILLIFEGYHRGTANILMAVSCAMGIFMERILFFHVERPVYFLSFTEDPDGKDRFWVRG